MREPPPALTEGSVYASVGTVESGRALGGTTADAVVVGGGTVGGMVCLLPRRSGLSRVVLLEASTLGQGASSRAAGIVRSQGGTPTAVRLAEWCRAFYLNQTEQLGHRFGIRAPGVLPSLLHRARRRVGPAADGHAAGARGQPVRWLDRDEATARNPTTGPGLDARRDLPRRRRLHPTAPERAGLHGGPGHGGRRGPRAGRLRRSGPLGRAGGRGARRVRGPSPPARWSSPVARSWPRWEPWPAPASRPAGSATRWRSPSRHPDLDPGPPARWSSTCWPASTGVPRRAACSSA